MAPFKAPTKIEFDSTPTFTKLQKSVDYPQNNIYHIVTPRFNEGMGEMHEIHLSSFQNIT
jgi:hypothetical protein